MPIPRWTPRSDPPAPEVVAELHAALRLPEPMCRLLAVRGLVTPAAAKTFLKPRLSQLEHAERLAGIEQAVARLNRAIEGDEAILVHGDYDVDGVCATALYASVLRHAGAARVEPFVPRRLEHGYDLSEAGIRAAVEVGAGVILTADCGVLAHGAVARASELGIDVIVTDHHTPGETLPPAAAVVNPNRVDCPYPDKGLCGAGVAFRVCQALVGDRGGDITTLWPRLDLVALATIADLMPLVGDNRVLARYGLKVLAGTENPGLRALLAVTGLGGGRPIGSGQVGHVLAPRINAVGRLDDAAWAVKLLLTEDEAEAERIAQRLDACNGQRQEVDRRTLRDALAMLAETYDPARDYGVVLAGEGWHPGVIGIVASRVVERVHRPTVMIALGEGERVRGSARSIPGFHLYDALRDCADLLERFGGHRFAAGLELRRDRIEAFRSAFNERVRQVVVPEDLRPKLAIDTDLRLAEATPELYRLLRHLGPFGVANPSPVFAARGVRVVGEPRVVGEDHLKLRVGQDEAGIEAIGFRMADRLELVRSNRESLDMAYQLQQDTWNGRTELQARLVDVRAAQ